MKKDDTRIETYEAFLPVPLTDAELLALGGDMATKQNEVATLENDLASIKSDYKAKIDQKEASLAAIGEKIRSKREFRDIACKRVFDYQAGEIYEVRLDTGAELSRRNMTGKELQRELALPTKPTEKKDAKEGGAA